jgi:hypothetical protein
MSTGWLARPKSTLMIQQKHNISTPVISMKLCFQTAEQNCTTLAWIWSKERGPEHRKFRPLFATHTAGIA